VVRKDVTVLAKGKEEPPYDPHQKSMVEECQVITEKPAARKSTNHIGESYKAFSLLEIDLQTMACNFELKYGDGDEDGIVWKIPSETQQITLCPMEKEQASRDQSLPGDTSLPGDDPCNHDITWDKDLNKVDYNSILFEKFFPLVIVKARVLDEYLSQDSTSINPDQPNVWNSKVEKDNI
jgi:hypothetical protein